MLLEEHLECPSEKLLVLLAGQWTLKILWVLSNNGPTRFGKLRCKIDGISAKVLTERLRKLEGEEIIYRDYKATIPPQVTYGLADKGKDLTQVVMLIDKVAQKWQKVST